MAFIEKLTKKHVGQTIYGLPQGNIARYHDNKPVEIKVISVSRVYARISTASYDKTGEQYEIEENCYKSDSNSGFKLYDEKEDVEIHINAEKMLFKIKDKLQYARVSVDLTPEKIEKIHNILFDNEQGE